MLRTVVALLALAAAAPAQDAIDTFTGGVNQGGWTYGGNSAVQMTGGNPDAWLHVTNIDTFAPMLRTTGGGGPFTGDWRAKGIRSVGVDLITVATQFPFERECTLQLNSGATSIYYLGTDFVPQPSEGWKSFEFKLDPSSTTMPPGWAVLNGGAPDPTWNAVIQNVTQVTFFYGDPTFFFIFDIWNVGADNIRVSSEPVWTDVGFALAGAGGTATLSGSGQLQAGSKTTISIDNAAPGVATTLVVGLSDVFAPFKGGTMVPNVNSLFVVVTSPVTGDVDLITQWPSGIPSGTPFYLQDWWPDAGGPKGFAATNALQVMVP